MGDLLLTIEERIQLSNFDNPMIYDLNEKNSLMDFAAASSDFLRE